MTTDEIFHTAEWLIQRIEANPPAGVGLQAYLDQIPPSQDLPAVRMSVQTPQDVRGIGDARERIMTRLDWLIVVTNEGHLVSPILPHVIALDNALHNKEGSTANIRVLSCIRIEPFELLEPEDSGVQYRHAGSIYRTLVQSP